MFSYWSREREMAMEMRDCVTPTKATPEYVLAVLRNELSLVHWAEWGVASELELTFDTSIRELRDEYDLVTPEKLGRVLDDQWQLGCSDQQWQNVLEPAGEKTLRGVCELIAERTTAYEVVPAKVLGRECLTAGAFFALRSHLDDAGLVTRDVVAPSDPLSEFAEKHPGSFIETITRLAPGALEQMEITNLAFDRAIAACGVGFLAVLIGVGLGLLGWSFGGYLMAAGLLTCVVAPRIASAFTERGVVVVTFGEMETLGDLARRVADCHSRR